MSKEIIKNNSESGQTMAEYAVVLGVITAAIVATISLLSGAINTALTDTLDIMQSVF